jgi:CheY-like chemotaxis protein
MTKLPILYAEDEEHDVSFLLIAFDSVGLTHPIQVAHDGQEAIDYLSGSGEFRERERFPLPCLIILDLKMPRRDGFEVLRWLRQESGLPYVAVIIFSSSRREEDIESAYRLGANSFVVKPTGVQERAAFAKCIKDFWLGFHEHCPPRATPVTKPESRRSFAPNRGK